MGRKESKQTSKQTFLNINKNRGDNKKNHEIKKHFIALSYQF